MPAVSIPVTVQPQSSVPVLLNLTADPASHRLQVGQTGTSVIKAVYDNAENPVVTDQAVWISSDPAIASVSDKGLITGAAAGEATITASFGGKSVVVSIVVSEAPAPAVVDLVVTPAALSLTLGKTQSLGVTAKYSDLSTALKTLEAEYTSANTSVAAVSAAGVVTANGIGTTNITVIYGGVKKEIQVTVTTVNGNHDGGTAPVATPAPSGTAAPAVTPAATPTATPSPVVSSEPQLPTLMKPVFNSIVDHDKIKAMLAKGRLLLLLHSQMPLRFSGVQYSLNGLPGWVL